MKRASAAIVAVAAAALTLMATASAVAGAVPAQEAGRPADFAWGLPLILDGESGSPAWRVALP